MAKNGYKTKGPAVFIKVSNNGLIKNRPLSLHCDIDDPSS